MYGVGFDGAGDGFDALLAAADDPTPATARAAAGDAPVAAPGQGDPQEYAWLAGGLPPMLPPAAPQAAQPAGVGAGEVPERKVKYNCRESAAKFRQKLTLIQRDISTGARRS